MVLHPNYWISRRTTSNENATELEDEWRNALALLQTYLGLTVKHPAKRDSHDAQMVENVVGLVHRPAPKSKLQWKTTSKTPPITSPVCLQFYMAKKPARMSTSGSLHRWQQVSSTSKRLPASVKQGATIPRTRLGTLSYKPKSRFSQHSWQQQPLLFGAEETGEGTSGGVASGAHTVELENERGSSAATECINTKTSTALLDRLPPGEALRSTSRPERKNDSNGDGTIQPTISEHIMANDAGGLPAGQDGHRGTSSMQRRSPFG
jgi:hypothetical protein